MHRNGKERGRFHLGIVVPAAVMGLIGFVVWLAIAKAERTPADSGDPAPVRLEGVRPDVSDDVLDRAGRKIREEVYLGSDDRPWAATDYRRDFIFHVPGTNALVGAPWLNVSYDLPGGGTYTHGFQTRVQVMEDGAQQVMAETLFPNSSRRRFYLWNYRRMLRQVDLVLQFHLQQPGPALSEFRAPFQTGRTQSDPAAGYQLTPSTNQVRGGVSSAEFELTMTNNAPTNARWIIVTDRSGVRHPAAEQGAKQVSAAKTIYFRVRTVNLDQVARISIEQPREKKFHHIRVQYADRPVRTYPEWCDKVKSALNLALPPEKVPDYPFGKVDEAVRVVDLVRGRHIEWCVNVSFDLRSVFDSDDLPDQPVAWDRLWPTGS